MVATIRMLLTVPSWPKWPFLGYSSQFYKCAVLRPSRPAWKRDWNAQFAGKISENGFGLCNKYFWCANIIAVITDLNFLVLEILKENWSILWLLLDGAFLIFLLAAVVNCLNAEQWILDHTLVLLRNGEATPHKRPWLFLSSKCS